MPLEWLTTTDEHDNTVWEALAPVGDDGMPFMFRITQRLCGNEHEFVEASTSELILHDDASSWSTLELAQQAMEEDAALMIMGVSE
jgi:hypothetical protein